MAQEDPRTQYGRVDGGRSTWDGSYGDQPDSQSLGELLKRLSNDTGELFTQEISLAKAELKESAANIGKGATKLGVGVSFALIGMIALTAAAVIGVGHLFGEHFGWSALVVGFIETAIAVVSIRGAMSSMKAGSIKPDATIETLHEDANWAKKEARDLKRDMTTNPAMAQPDRQGRRDGSK